MAAITPMLSTGVRQADLPPADRQAEILDKYGLKPGQYIVAVARFVEEKGLHDLVAAYAAAGCSVPLVLIGDADHADEYSERLKQQADRHAKRHPHRLYQRRAAAPRCSRRPGYSCCPLITKDADRAAGGHVVVTAGGGQRHSGQP